MDPNHKDLDALEAVKGKLNEACEYAKRVGRDNGGEQPEAYIIVDTTRIAIESMISTTKQ